MARTNPKLGKGQKSKKGAAARTPNPVFFTRTVDVKASASSESLPCPERQVAIFGAGIAGLTAAHELVERGYHVEVYEKAPADPMQARLHGEPCAIGGMARTRWGRIPAVLQTIGFDQGKYQVDSAGTAVVARIVEMLKKAGGEVMLEVRGFASDKKLKPTAPRDFDASSPPPKSAEIDVRRAWNVAKAIHDKFDRVSLRVRGMGLGVPVESPTADARPNYVGFRLIKGEMMNQRQAVDLLPIHFRVIPFEKKTLKLKAPATARIADVASQIKSVKEADFIIEVHGYCSEPSLPMPAQPFDPTVDPTRAKAPLDLQRAWSVAKHLVDKGVDRNSLMLRPMGRGETHDCGGREATSDFVEFHVLEDIVPGEHGFRFFPWFYRNLFHTLRRIPVADDRSVEYYETPRTVMHNLLEVPLQAVARDRSADPDREDWCFEFQRRPAQSLDEVFRLFNSLLNTMGYRLSDISRHQMKLFKYMTSSPERRAREYEYQSWSDFMDAAQYSDEFRGHFESAGQITLANRAAHSDARTYGNVTVQLMLNQMSGADRTDSILNGPTSAVWFDHWRRYLEAQGVEFHQGELQGFDFFDKQPYARAKIVRQVPSSDPDDSCPKLESKVVVLARDYFVVAIPVQALRQIADKEKNTLRGEDFDRVRNLKLGKTTDAEPEGMLQHLSGIQYFLDTDGGFVQGHTNYVDSEWGLSSIAQPQFWIRKRGWWDGYRGVLSVDIGDWNRRGDGDRGNIAWEMTRDEIAAEVWRQVRRTVKYKNNVPASFLAYYMDMAELENGKRDDDEPYLVTRPGEYPLRPGRLDVKKTFNTADAQEADDEKNRGYEVHFGKVVLAGTHMQTYTRLTTMEAANESGRHAVNGILQADGFNGARCKTFNPEDHEPADLKALRILDAKLLASGLPHFLDILELRDLPSALLCGEPATEVASLVKEALTSGGGKRSVKWLTEV